MAIELRVTSVTVLVTGEPREKQIWQGRGDDSKPVGRLTDVEGRPLSAVPAVVLAEPLGMLGDATVLLPDMQVAGLVPGAIVRVEGNTTARISGGEHFAIRASITGERVTPVGQFQELLSQARPVKAGDGRAA
jgi:hypothetical protein